MKKKISQSVLRHAQMGNEPKPFAPNPAVAFDQQNAMIAAQEAVSNSNPGLGHVAKVSHYKKGHLPSAKPLVK